MKAFVLTGPGSSEVQDLPSPVPSAGHVGIDVARVGICGTDVEFFTGEMEYLRQGHTTYPLILGHEWCGTVSSVGPGDDPAWVGRRVTGDTMLGCGTCDRCLGGRHHVCATRSELGIRGVYPGALAEQVVVPITALLSLPDTVDDASGAMVEPGGNALRCVDATGLVAGERLLILGPGTIGLLVAGFAQARGIDVHLVGATAESLAFADSLGFANVSLERDLPDLPFDAVVDATNSAASPARAVELVEPGRRVVYIGLSGTPSQVDSRDLALKDVTAVGILGASAGLAGAIEGYAEGSVDPRPLIAATVGLDEAHDALTGWRPSGSGPGPKLHVDPRIHE